MKRKVLICLIVAVIGLLAGCSRTPEANQIKRDLIGQTMKSIDGLIWKFNDLSEFQEFRINSRVQQGEMIEYGIGMRLKDATSGRQYLADVLIVYRKSDGAWKLASILNKSLKEVQ